MLTSQFILSILPQHTEKIFLAFSGGKDSHVLLHLLSSIPDIRHKVTAVYVNHGLQSEALAWGEHCQAIALGVHVDFHCLTVNAHKEPRQSQEEVARNARYQALQPLLTEKDVLLLAQHQEDQLETVLLQLFRGAGVQGLAGMPLSTGFGKGQMIRPLLDVSQAAISAYAEQHDLHWIEDPSNQDNTFDRNFLRNQILPQLKQRWPALDKTVSRAARHCAQSHFLNADLSRQLLHPLYNKEDQSLAIQPLLELDDNQQYLVIRQWFAMLHLRMPSEKTVITIVAEVLGAKPSANPEIKNKRYCIKRYRKKLYCFKADTMPREEGEQHWKKGLGQLALKHSTLTLCRASTGISRALWDSSTVWVRFRKGAEKIQPSGREGHHTLKKLFQEIAMPPWERGAIPLIYMNGELAAVADLWVSADFMCDSEEECLQFKWSRTNAAQEVK